MRNLMRDIAERIDHIEQCERKGWFTRMRTHSRMTALKLRRMQHEAAMIAKEAGDAATVLEGIANEQ